MLLENQLSYQIRGAIFEVYNELGPGLLESVCHKALLLELKSRKLKVDSEVVLPVFYKGELLNMNFRMDLVVENRIIIEIKSVEELHKVHHKQMITYLKLADKELGILVNFNTDSIPEQIFRKINVKSPSSGD
ncbi:MAG: GxxExxY protein [Bacteroidota bacterium]